MIFPSFFTTKVVAIIAGVLIALVLSWGTAQYLRLQATKVEAAELKTQRDEAGRARDTAIEANKVTQATLDQLKREKEDIQKALNALEADRRRNQQVINTLADAIKAQSSDPANKVQLSPVLKTTVEGIQKQRELRQGGAK